jgi:uncharacterized protein YndB with AHSA1/START domain
MGSTTIRAEVEIRRPLAEVFAYCTDVAEWCRWQSRFSHVEQLSPGPFGIGTRIRTVTMGMGRTHEGTSEVIEFAPDQRLRFAGASDVASFESLWTFTPTPSGGARVAVETQFTPRDGALLAQLVQPFVGGVFRRRLDADLEAMRLLLEHSASEASASAARS